MSSPALPPQIDLAFLSQILGQGATASPLIAVKGPLMNKKDYSLTFSLKHALKDMSFALGLGVKVRHPLRRDGHHVTCACFQFCSQVPPDNRWFKAEIVLSFIIDGFLKLKLFILCARGNRKPREVVDG